MIIIYNDIYVSEKEIRRQ